MTLFPVSGPVVCFAKHAAGLRGFSRLIRMGADIRLLVVSESENYLPWYTELERLCHQNGIEFLTVTRLSRQPEVWEIIKTIQPVIGYTMLFTQIIPPAVIDSFKIGIVNFHPSLLPKYRGPHPVNWAIINGEAVHGVTAHLVSDVVDGGPVLMQTSFPINKEDTNISLQTVIDDTIEMQVEETFKMFKAGVLNPLPQDDSEASYYPKRSPEDGRILWESMGAEDIQNLVRALQPPLYGAFCMFKGNAVVVRQASVGPQSDAPSGRVLNTNSGIHVATKSGSVCFHRVEDEKGKIFSLSLFSKGDQFT